MNTLFLSLLIFVGWTTFACCRLNRIPETFNLTADALTWPWLVIWYVAVWLSAFFAAPSLVEATTQNMQWLAFITIASAIVIGIFPSMGSAVDTAIERVASVTYVVASQLMVLLSDRWYLMFIWVLPIIYWKVFHLPCWKFCIGVIATVIIYIYCFI